jgi:hypothetical protein
VAEEFLVGVVAEHPSWAGQSTLIAVPLTALRARGP